MDVIPTFYSREASAASVAAFKRRFWKLHRVGPALVTEVSANPTYLESKSVGAEVRGSIEGNPLFGWEPPRQMM